MLKINNKIIYIDYCINKFADKFKINVKYAFDYLEKFNGLAFLDECYEAEHLLSLEDAVEDITLVCKRYGGNIG